MENRSATKWVTAAGIVFAFAAPVVAGMLTQAVFGGGQLETRAIVGLALHWLTFAVMILVVLRIERLPLTSIGVRSVRWWTIPFGVLAGIVITLASGLLVKVLGLHADASYVALLQTLPLVLRILLAVTAGVFEETLYRGYAFERLATATGSRWIAAACTVVVFTVTHAPAVGWSHLLPVGIVASLVTLLYLWRRDLVLNMVAHATIDAIGLLVAPLLAHA